MEYANHLNEYAPAWSEAQVAEEVARIREAERYVPLEQICISPQCGFSSTLDGNDLPEEAQWKKLALLKETADEVFGEGC